MDMLRPSKLGAWADCERRAYTLHTLPADIDDEPGLPSIRAWAGSRAHEHLASKLDGRKVIDFETTVPPMFQQDRLITGPRHAEQIAARTAEAAYNAIRREGSMVLASELPVESPETGWDGTLDILIQTPFGCGIVDFKTGKYSNAAWLQLGAYAVMHSDLPGRDPVERLGILHVRFDDYAIWSDKTRSDAEQELPRIEWRDALPIIKEAKALMFGANSVAATCRPPNINPSSFHCGHCIDSTCPFNLSTSTGVKP